MGFHEIGKSIALGSAQESAVECLRLLGLQVKASGFSRNRVYNLHMFKVTIPNSLPVPWYCSIQAAFTES